MIIASIAASPLAAMAASCGCLPDIYSKKYIYFEETWYGTRRSWTCEYKCIDKNKKETIVKASYADWYTSDNGTEGVCEGIPFESQFNPHVMRDVYMPKDPVWFNPAKSKSKELKAWAQLHCR